jgi:uncharacterized membrane protein
VHIPPYATPTAQPQVLTQPPGRLSLADSTNEVFLDDDPSEDWTRTTAEKDSWAHRERRRSSVWQKIDSYPSLRPVEVSPSQSRERHGSVLSLFHHGKDKNGRDVLHSGDGDPEEWSAGSGAERAEIERPPSNKPAPRERHGSILSIWTWGKDKFGRDVIHSGPDVSE